MAKKKEKEEKKVKSDAVLVKRLMRLNKFHAEHERGLYKGQEGHELMAILGDLTGYDLERLTQINNAVAAYLHETEKERRKKGK